MDSFRHLENQEAEEQTVAHAFWQKATDAEERLATDKLAGDAGRDSRFHGYVVALTQ